MHYSHLMLIPALLVLAACGTTKQERALGGAAVGAGAGALVGSVVGAPVRGAVIGAGVGAATGAATDSSTINLGKPWWK